jgi:type VI protein secretion system component VasK
LTVVTVCRATRYIVIAMIADYYGRHFVHVLRHPGEYWISLLLLAFFVFSVTIAAIMLNRRMATHSRAGVLRKGQYAQRDVG